MKIYITLMNNFVQYLDSIKSRKEIGYNELLILYSNIEKNYYINNYKNILNEDTPHNKIDYSYYTIYNTPRYFTNINSNDNNLFKSKYDLWLREHETNISLPENIDNIPKIKKNIEVSVESLQDLIDIVNNNEYSDNIEYNINLKALLSIKYELNKLNEMIGMVKFKKSIVKQILYFIQDLHEGNNDFKHTVIYGPPGTGKTEIAKIMGHMYSKIGILKKNTFKKVTRNDLIAGYLGQTALKTKNVINECLGGVLFIDEAYSLGSQSKQDSYSSECIDILCESMSDHKEDLMVIIAGYEEELNTTFFEMNQGLNSRFIWRFKIDDYTSSELMQILQKKIKEQLWELENENILSINWFEKRKENFKNYGRDMELLLFHIKIEHSKRIYGKDAKERKKITSIDLEKGYESFLENSKNKDKNLPNHIYGLYV